MKALIVSQIIIITLIAGIIVCDFMINEELNKILLINEKIEKCVIEENDEDLMINIKNLSDKWEKLSRPFSMIFNHQYMYDVKAINERAKAAAIAGNKDEILIENMEAKARVKAILENGRLSFGNIL